MEFSVSTGNQNLDLLIKLLRMTTSSNDSEALLAMRKANEQLARFGQDWEALLKGRVTVVADPFLTSTPPQPTVTKQAPKASPPPPPPPRPTPRTTPPPPPPRYQQYAKPTPPPQPQVHWHYASRPFKLTAYDAICADCQRRVPAGKGIIWRVMADDHGVRLPNTAWQIKCDDGYGCQAASPKAAGARPKLDPATLMNSLGLGRTNP